MNYLIVYLIVKFIFTSVCILFERVIGLDWN